MKEEALKLIDELNQIDEVAYVDLKVIEEAIVMIRMLVAENEFLKDWRDTWSPFIKEYIAKTKE
jgi:hypothetical protein